MRITIVAANSVEFDSRLRRTAAALAGDGHAVTMVGFAGSGLADVEPLPGAPDVTIRRIALDRRISAVFRPLPAPVRAALCRLAGIDPEATVLPPASAVGVARLLGPVRRAIEIGAILRRTGPWADAVIRAAPGTDVFHAKALVALPVARRAARRTGARYAYDIADLHTEAARLARMPGIVRRLVRGREAGWVRDAAALFAVSDGVADEAARRFGVARPVLLLNVPPAWRPDEPDPAVTDRLRAAAGLSAGRAVVLYHGGLSVDRGIEELIAALDAPPLARRDVTAVFLGYGRLRDLVAAEAARRPARIVLLDAVPPTELLEWIATADVGYVGQPGRTLNQRLNLANKLFECLMAGVPVVAASGTAHAAFVDAEGVGAHATIEDPAALAAAIATLLDLAADELAALRRHCRRLALERFHWEAGRAGLLARYRELAVDLTGGDRAPA